MNPQFDPDSCRRFLLLVDNKWDLSLLHAVLSFEDRARYGAIKRRTGIVSQKMLAQSLRKLERDGLIERNLVLNAAPVGVEYAATDLARTMCEALRGLQAWVQLHFVKVEDARRRFDDRDR